MKAILLILLTLIAACNKEKPKLLGVFQDGLYPCPLDNKCVSSTQSAEDKPHYIEPIPVEGDYSEVFSRLQNIISKNPDFKLIVLNPTYLHYEHTAGLFKTIHDVEIFYSQDKKLTHLRAESRGKIPDFGKSRTLLEDLKFKYFQRE